MTTPYASATKASATDESNVIPCERFYVQQDYRYGAYLADHGIGMKEMMEDFPKTCLREDVMRGYRDAWRQRGYVPPPW